MSKYRKSPPKATTMAANGTLRPVEIGLMIRFGKEIDTDTFVLTAAAARAEIARRRCEIAALEKLGRSRLAWRLGQDMP